MYALEKTGYSSSSTNVENTTSIANPSGDDKLSIPATSAVYHSITLKHLSHIYVALWNISESGSETKAFQTRLHAELLLWAVMLLV